MDDVLVRLLSDPTLSKDILCVLLELVAFFDKEARELPSKIQDAAKACALGFFKGELDQPVPAITLCVQVEG